MPCRAPHLSCAQQPLAPSFGAETGRGPRRLASRLAAVGTSEGRALSRATRVGAAGGLRHVARTGRLLDGWRQVEPWGQVEQGAS